MEWRPWWVRTICLKTNHVDISLDYPPSIVCDETFTIEEFDSDIASGLLGRLRDSANKCIIPTLLCPWSCSGFIHDCGHIKFDVIFQRHFPKCIIDTISTDIDRYKVISSRDDYLRSEIKDYDTILTNQEWKVLPRIAIVDGHGPMFLSCLKHNNGCKHNYIHPMRIPNHIIPSRHGDQLCHAVLKPRTIKSMKAGAYSNSYQTQEQRGSFNGIDTCDITNYGDFSFCSKLLDENESRAIAHRPDINALLSKLMKSNILSKEAIKNMRDSAKSKFPDDNSLMEYWQGATYISFDDAIELQRQIGEVELTEVIVDKKK